LKIGEKETVGSKVEEEEDAAEVKVADAEEVKVKGKEEDKAVVEVGVRDKVEVKAGVEDKDVGGRKM